MSEKVPNILEDYAFIKDIGEGNFGKVKLSKLIATNEKYAIKILNKEKLKAQTKSSSINEIEILSKLNHPNVIHVEKILEDDINFYIIMEYCSKGELFDYIVKQEKLNEIEASMFFYQLIIGVEYIHKQKLAHRDLKPENLLLTKNHLLKIIDFGLCHDFDGTKLLKTKCGSPSYAAPEILKGFPYNGFKSDIWCCGIILYGMLCGYLPFDGDNNQEIFKQIVQCNPEFPPFLEDDSIDLLAKILNDEPNERMNINQIKKHPFFIKGKHYYFKKYDGNGEIREESVIKSQSNSNTSLYDNNVDNKKQYIYSTIKKQKDNAIMINNYKTLNKKNHKKYEKNIYKNIFTTIGYKEEINNKKNKKIFLKTSEGKNNYQEVKSEKDYNYNNKENKDLDLNKDNHELRNITEAKENDQKQSIFLRTFKNKLNEKKLNIFDKNSDNNTINYKSNSSSKRKESIQKNKILFDIYTLNATKSNERRPYNKMNLIINNKKRFITKYDKNNLKEKRGKKEGLDFLQNFLSNKVKNNKNEISIKSPEKRNELNFNLIINKTRKKDREKESILSERKTKNNESSRNKAFSVQKIKKSFSQKKKLNFNFVNSPSTNVRKSHTKKDKFNILFNDKDKIYLKNNDNNYAQIFDNEHFSFSIKKNNKNNKKFDGNKNMKLININSKGNSVKKFHKNIFIKTNPNYRNEAIKEIILKNNLSKKQKENIHTETKSNQFLEKVIKKMYTKDKPIINNNINIITFNNNFGNEHNHQVFRMLDINQDIRNTNDLIECPYIINKKNDSNNENENKKHYIDFKNDKKIFLLKNPKILDNNRLNSKEKMKRIFPSLMTNNKNI